MGFFKKMFGMFVADDVEDDEEIIEEEEAPEETEETEPDTNSNPEKKPASTPKSVELKVISLTTYDANIKKVADHLLKRRTVVLNIEGASKESTKRIIDFLSGVVYSIDGEIKPIANGTYLIAPSNVSVTGDQLAAIENETENIDTGSSIDEF